MVVPSPSLDPHEAKQALREAALTARRDYARSLAAETRAALEANLAERVRPHLAGGAVIGAYHPLRDEISPLPLLALLAPNRPVALPWFADRDSRMMWRRAPATVPGPWGMAQPDDSAEALAPGLLLVPLVLADRHGTRIGHGKGHYDRAIAHLREGGGVVRTIGLAWDMQIADSALPAEPFDQRLDAICTPGAYLCWNR